MKLLFVVICAIILINETKALPFRDVLQLYDLLNKAIDETENETSVTETLAIPMRLRNCTKMSCEALCQLLGYDHGACVPPSTCHCYKSALSVTDT